MTRKTTLTAVLFFLLLLPPGGTRAAAGELVAFPAYREGEVLVKFRPGSNEEDRGRARGLVNAGKVRNYSRIRIEKISLGPGVTALEAVAMLKSDPSVEFAELNWRARYLDMPRVEPNDPLFGDQWHLDADLFPGYFVTSSRPVSIDIDLDAPEAWAVMEEVFGPTTGGSVGVLDSGCGELGYFHPSIGYVPNHEDLPSSSLGIIPFELTTIGFIATSFALRQGSSLWVNTVELGNIGVNDDGNGYWKDSEWVDYIDDVNGWDFMDFDNDLADEYDSGAPYHGTFICGIIASGWGNGKGGAGVGAGRLKVQPLRTLYSDEIVSAIEYAINTSSGTPPVLVLNASWAFDRPIQSLLTAIEAAGEAGIAFVAAAGNDGNNNDPGAGIYPAEYTKVPLENLLAVSASNANGSLAYFSNYGPASVQVAAPGQDILSVYGGTDDYRIGSGTSFAAPIAASALAIIMSVNPALTPAQAIDRLLDGGDFDARLSGLIRSGKRVNLAGALAPFAPFSGYVPLDTLQPVTLYDDPASALYGSIVSAVSDSPSAAVMVSLPSGSWAVSPVAPGLASFTLMFDGPSAPAANYETGIWRVTGISPFSAEVGVGHALTFTSLIPSSNISWRVMDPQIGSIDSDGVFIPLAEGMTRVVLNVDGQDVDNSGVVLVVILDGDNDGYEGDVDCDDTDPDIHPGADEVCSDGIDNDCDGYVDSQDAFCDPSLDEDQDGYQEDVDCDDTDPDIHPGADEVCNDGIDNDCDGYTDGEDADCSIKDDGGSGGGGCGTTAQPPGDPWSGMAGMAAVLMLLVLMKKRAALSSPRTKVQSPK